MSTALGKIPYETLRAVAQHEYPDYWNEVSDYWQRLYQRVAVVMVGDWIPVDVRLPPKDVEVMIAFVGQSSLAATGQYTNNAMDHGGWCYPQECRVDAEEGLEWPLVTHWRPLPDIPKGGA